MRRLAMTKDGNFSYCCSRDELLGKGRCNHVEIASANESETQFKERIEREGKMPDKKIQITSIPKFDFTLPADYFKDKPKKLIVHEYVYIAAVNLRLKKEIDSDGRYFFQKETVIPNPDDLKSLQNSYYLNKENFENKISEFKKTVPEWYESIPCQETFKPTEEEKEAAQKFVDSLNTKDEKCYWYFRTKSEIDQYKSFMKNNPEYMKTKNILKADFKEKYNAKVDELYAVTGYPGEAKIKSMVVNMVPSVKKTQLRNIDIEINESICGTGKFWEIAGAPPEVISVEEDNE